MTRGLRLGRRLGGPRCDGDGVAAARIPEQAGAALLAEPPVDTGHHVLRRAEPLETPILREHEVVAARRRVGEYVPVNAPAVAAVAKQDIP